MLTSCYNYKEINQEYFATALGVDINENNNIVVFVEAFVASRTEGQKEGKEKSIIFKKEGETLFEAIRKINLSSRYKVNYMHNKAILISERAARKGMDEFIDMLFRDQEFLFRQYIFIYDGDIEELLNVETKEDPFVGIFLNSLMMNKSATAATINLTFGEYMARKDMGSKVNIINKVYLVQGPKVKEIGINSLAVINDDKMIGELTLDEGRAYSIIKDLKFRGFYPIPHPSIPGKSVTLEILRTKTKSNIYYDGQTIHVIKTPNIKTVFSMTEGPIDLENKEIREYLVEEISKNVVSECTKLFKKYKDMGVDILNLKLEIERKYPELVANEDFLDNVQLKVIPKIKLNGSSDVTNYN